MANTPALSQNGLDESTTVNSTRSFHVARIRVPMIINRRTSYRIEHRYYFVVTNNEITPMSLRRATRTPLSVRGSTDQHMTDGKFRPLIPDW